MKTDHPSLDKLFELDTCPCEVCSSQDNEDTLLDRQKLDEVCDLFANEMIDYLLKNPRKYLLKKGIKQSTVK